MLQQHRLRAPRQPGDILAVGVVVLLQEKLHQQWNVFQAFGQRRNADLDGTQPVEKILAKTAGQHFGAQIAVGGGDQAHVDLLTSRGAYALDFAVLDDPQQLGLHGQRGFANFVQEHRAAVGVLEQARGECPSRR